MPVFIVHFAFVMFGILGGRVGICKGVSLCVLEACGNMYVLFSSDGSHT